MVFKHLGKVLEKEGVRASTIFWKISQNIFYFKPFLNPCHDLIIMEHLFNNFFLVGLMSCLYFPRLTLFD
jgi:hypothetical protein